MVEEVPSLLVSVVRSNLKQLEPLLCSLDKFGFLGVSRKNKHHRYPNTAHSP